jgi:hypothetical protein
LVQKCNFFIVTFNKSAFRDVNSWCLHNAFKFGNSQQSNSPLGMRDEQAQTNLLLNASFWSHMHALYVYFIIHLARTPIAVHIANGWEKNITRMTLTKSRHCRLGLRWTCFYCIIADFASLENQHSESQPSKYGECVLWLPWRFGPSPPAKRLRGIWGPGWCLHLAVMSRGKYVMLCQNSGRRPLQKN